MNLMEKIGHFPAAPGVYLMKGEGGVILYVGKAKKLSDRIRTYFQRATAHTPRIQHMIELVTHIETTVTKTELEAIILENNLIKKYRPRFNVVLRDDKNYPYLRLPIHEDYPRPQIVRRVEKDGALYFGPYVPTHALRETLKLLRRLFPIPNCNIVIDGKAERACIEFEIKRCLAPCTGHQSREQYHHMIGQLKLFLEGKDKELIKTLRSQMEIESASLRFEEAARIRDQIQKVERTLERQRITTTDQIDLDVIGMVRSGDYLNLQVLFIRGGMLTGRKGFFMKGVGETPDGEVIGSFLQQFYSKNGLVPPRIVIPSVPEDGPWLQQWLSDRRNGPVHLSPPGSDSQPGFKLMRLAQENAAMDLESQFREQELGSRALQEIQRLLRLERRPDRIEAFDISNIMGDQAVGSMVVFQDGRAQKSAYRHFKIRTIQGANDFGMMEEVLRRAYARRVRESKPLPDLILIDGGKGQLSAALDALREVGVVEPGVIALAKAKGDRFERIFMPGDSNAIALAPNSPATHLIQRIRDEAHRFAISHHRKLRGKELSRSELDRLPGIGPARKRLLLQRFEGMEGIRHASVSELMQVRGITEAMAEEILRVLHQKQASDP